MQPHAYTVQPALHDYEKAAQYNNKGRGFRRSADYRCL
jgi:hypothetical protein